MRKIWLTTAAALALPAAAIAGTFDVKGPDVARGETEIGANSSFFRGFPENAERLRLSWELGLSYGVTDWLKLGAKINFDKPLDDDHQASTAGIEAQFSLKKFDQGFGLGWYGGMDFALINGDPNVMTFGPILQFGNDKTTLAINPFLQREFGDNPAPGIAFSYAWQVKHQVREGFAVGIEGFGAIPDIGHSPSTAFQEHRIGPVLYFERELNGHGGNGKMASIKDMKGGNGGGDNGNSGAKFFMETGVLFGLTEATQDVTLKVKGGFTF